jgi:hypothetical protein
MATTKTYGSLITKAFNKEIDWESDTIKVALVTSSYTPNQDSHDYFDDVSANEVSGTGYTAGGATLASKTIGYTSGTNVTKFDAADVSWTSSTITARYAVIYDTTPGTSATNPLIAYVDFGSDQSSSNGTFAIVWDAAGIFTTTAD